MSITRLDNPARRSVSGPGQNPSTARTISSRAVLVSGWQRTLGIAFTLYLVALGLIVWLPAEQAGQVTGIVDSIATIVASWGIPYALAYPVLEFIANIALFVPFGILLAPLLQGRVPVPLVGVVTVLGAGTTLMIELVQQGVPGRYSTFSDVLANTLGALIGALVAVALLRLIKSPARAKSLSIGN